MSITRKDNHSALLREYVAKTRSDAFSCPDNDCAHWTAGALKATCSGLPSAKLAKLLAYTDEASAEKVKTKLGGFAAAITGILGVEAKGGNNARRGDVVLFHPAPNVETVGICLGYNFACVGDAGLNFFPMSRAECSWRVG